MAAYYQLTANALVFTAFFVLLAMGVSLWQRLELERDILIGAARTVVQLIAIGYVLLFVFKSENLIYVLAMLAVMIAVAVDNAAKRGRGVPGVKPYLALGITVSELVVLFILIAGRIAPFKAQYVIPLSGMVIGNAMVACGLVLNRLKAEVKGRHDEIMVYLTLGASSRQAAARAIKEAIKASMIPTIDSMKTVGLVQLPGMMTGMIIAGASPVDAVKYQVVIMFMMCATTALTSMVVGLLAYRRLFTPNHQLLP